MGGVGGFKRTCKGLFTGVANRLLELDPDKLAHAGVIRYRQGITPGLMHDATPVDLPEGFANTLGDHTHADIRALAPGETHS